MIPAPADFAKPLRTQLRALRRSIDRRDPVQRETERVLEQLVKLMEESVAVSVQQARLLHRAAEIEAEMTPLAERLQTLARVGAAAPTRAQ